MNTHVMPAADTRWTAVRERDREADGRFVYAVRSTGVYCRPSCPSRRPTRSAVDFFAGGTEARAAGYRACKRCRPDEPAADQWIDRIRRACVYLSNVDGHPSLETLARRVGGSPYHLQRNFKRIVGMSPREYADARRLDKVKRSLRRGGDVTSALLDAGFSSPSRFYERGGHKLGMSPSSYRKGGAGATIAYGTRATPIGVLMLAATARGVCAIALGDTAASLRRALAEEFPLAALTPAGPALEPWLTRAVEHVSGWSPRLDLPLDVRATAFQWQVWRALAAIPRGQTRSYAQVAEAIGRPSAVRAVARACATNPVALAIPCHRVVPTAGGVGGYRWGKKRKTALLDREAAGG